MNLRNHLEKYKIPTDILNMRTNKLLIVLGSLGDFDSFEYCQQIASKSNYLKNINLSSCFVGIGGEESKKRFCEFTGISDSNFYLVTDNSLHKDLELNSGLNILNNNLLSLLVMCSGIKSPGTLREVFRGYLGDNNSENIFNKDSTLTRIIGLRIKGSLFDILGSKDSLRPFELASQRLLNMIEILNNWRIYNPSNEYLTQRGGTFLLNNDNNILYEHRPLSLLSYSDNMSRPLQFLSKFLSIEIPNK